MPILNYTTKVDPDRTVGDIQRVLASHGVSGVAVEFGSDRLPSVLAFSIKTEFGDRRFRMPANIAGVERVLERQHERYPSKVPRRLVCREQATRVAWRILLDWIRSRPALVEAGLVTVDEAMLPYLLDGRGETLYQFMKGQRLALPAPA